MDAPQDYLQQTTGNTWHCYDPDEDYEELPPVLTPEDMYYCGLCRGLVPIEHFPHGQAEESEE